MIRPLWNFHLSRWIRITSNLLAFATMLQGFCLFSAFGAGMDVVPEDERAFVDLAGPQAKVHCGMMEMNLDPKRGFSMGLARKAVGAAEELLKSTDLRVWVSGKPQTLVRRSNLASLNLVEEGPQRIIVRAPYLLLGDAGKLLGKVQYDIVCYPEGEVYLTVRILPQTAEPFRAAMEFRFAGPPSLQFERAYDLPLLIGREPGVGCVGLYWHDGEPPQVGVISGEARCLLSCPLREDGDFRSFSRTFVVSLCDSVERLRERCLAHIDPLRPVFMESCRPLVEQSIEGRRIAESRPRWCYSFRDGAYNVFADAAPAQVEFQNDGNASRRIRVRFISRTESALAVSSVEPRGQPDIQATVLTPSLDAGHPAHTVASLAAFELSAHECPVIEAAGAPGGLLHWVGCQSSDGITTRVYRLASAEMPTPVAEIRVVSGSKGGAEVAWLRSGDRTAGIGVDGLSLFPAPTESWGRFSELKDVAVLRNRPGRAGLQLAFTNEQKNLKCSTQLALCATPGAISLNGYHTLEALGAWRLRRGDQLVLPTFSLAENAASSKAPTARFFFADRKGRIRVCEPSDRAGFGFDLGGMGGISGRGYGLCGFDDPTSWSVAFLNRPLTLDGRVSPGSTRGRIVAELEMPASADIGQVHRTFWSFLLVGSKREFPAVLAGSLEAIRDAPVDLTPTGVTDGRIAHRIHALGPSGNPLSADDACYLLNGGEQLAIIGAGVDGVRWPWLFRIQALGFDPSRISAIFLTDAAVNHAGGARALRRMTGAPVYVHAMAVEALSVAGPEQDLQTDAPWRESGAPFDSCTVDEPLLDNQMIRVGDLNVGFIDTPGRTEASGSFLVKSGGLRVGFVGDLLPANADGDWGGTDAHRGGNLPMGEASIRRFRDEHVDLALSDAGPLSGMQAIADICNQALSRADELSQIPGVEFSVPRLMVAAQGDTEGDAAGGYLAEFKEMAVPLVWRKKPAELAPGVWIVGGGFFGEPEDGNVYLVDGGSKMALIGAGSGLHTARIIDRILSLGKNPLDIDRILLPSAHWYEARGANAMRAVTGARVWAHRYEAQTLETGNAIGAGMLIGRNVFGTFPPCPVDRELSWGEMIRIGGIQVLVLDAPGFHRGSTAFLAIINGKRCLFSGQAAIGDLPTPEGDLVSGATGWLDYHWGGNIPQWHETLQRFISIDPQILLPGQGRTRAVDVKRQLNDCLARLERVSGPSHPRATLPAYLYRTHPAPRRPDLSRLMVNKAE